jgi:hypothetical protein
VIGNVRRPKQTGDCTASKLLEWKMSTEPGESDRYILIEAPRWGDAFYGIGCWRPPTPHFECLYSADAAYVRHVTEGRAIVFEQARRVHES